MKGETGAQCWRYPMGITVAQTLILLMLNPVSFVRKEWHLGKADIDTDAMETIEGPTGPFAMLNLFRMKKGEQFSTYQKAAAAVGAQALESAAVKVLYAGAAGDDFITGDEEWDYVMLVQYEDWNAFRAAICDHQIALRMNEIRKKYLADSRLILTTPLGR